MSLEVDQRFLRLAELIEAAADKSLDERTASYICRLGSVQICGNLERCIELIIIARLADRSPRQIANFLRRFFERGTNYDCERIAQLLFRFDSDWGRSFEDYIKFNDYIKESISSCYAVRNSVAHGGVQSLGSKILKQYYDASLDLTAKIQEIVS